MSDQTKPEVELDRLPDIVSVDQSEVARIKELLIRNPISAHGIARIRRGEFQHNDDHAKVILYDEVIRQLVEEGYAPGDDGQPGPAVKAHYQHGVMGG